MFRVAIAALTLWSSFAAGSIFFCEGEKYGYAITLNLIDAESGEPLRLKCDDTASIKDGNYEEVLQGIGNCSTGFKSVFGAQMRPGTYTVTVNKIGYAPDVQNYIEVAEDPCGHVIPRSLTVVLHRDET